MIVYKITKIDKFEEYHKDFFQDLLNDLKQNNLLSESIEEIILTDNFEGELLANSSDKFQNLNSKGKEFTSVAKIIAIESRKKIIYDANLINLLVPHSKQIFYQQAVEVYAEDLINEKYKVDAKFTSDTPFPDIIKALFSQWATKTIANTLESRLNYIKTNIHLDARMFVDSFKRNIRKLHFTYQSDLTVKEFWVKVILELDYFIRRCLDVKSDNGSFDNAQEFKELLPLLIIEIENQTSRILKGELLHIDNLKTYLTQLLKLCYINPEPYNSDLLIQVLDTPKNLFRGIIDTEPRIVAFMDILGFKDIIDEYDSDQYSNILKELHDALELAIESSIEKMIDPKTKSDISKYLEYRMFSDCICISLPYIEFENDFHLQFHSLSVILRSYQFLMMQKGFYIRGGISMGSFFADKNMIFSGGLVKAYKLEQSAIYPIIVIDNNILVRLKRNFKEFTKNLFFTETVLVSKETGKIFLNPFEFLDNPAKYFDFMQQTLKDLIEPEDGEADEFSGLISSFMKLTRSLVQPVFDDAKSQMTQENLNSAKQLLIDQIDKKIFNLNSRMDLFNLESKENIEVTKIIAKYEFIKNLIKWAIDKTTSDQFEEYKFE